MLSRIRIKGLYDIYNYDIDFSKHGKVLILTGPNGFGKTTILQIINHFCQGKFWLFYFLNFQLIELSDTRGRIIFIHLLCVTILISLPQSN